MRLEKTWEPKGLLARRSKQVHAAGMGEKDESWKKLKEPPITAEGGEWCHHQKEQTAAGFCPLLCTLCHCWEKSHLLGVASVSLSPQELM